MEPHDREQYNELLYYTLGHPDIGYFIHQHVVDAYTAQTADNNTKPIAIIFALVGLYLFIEKNYSGRKVQNAHMLMARNKKLWPEIKLPEQRGNITIENVLLASPGQERDSMIKSWCVSVWQAYENSHDIIASLVKTELGVQN
jgi:hypothetical protein